MRDITERRVGERNLQRAKDLAEEASRAKAQFLAAISHEMRTPLTGILGALDLIGETELTEHQRKYVQTANRSGHALLSVISDVLDISRLEAGKIDLDLARLDIPQIIDDVMEIIGRLAGERGNRISVHLDLRLPAGLSGDPARIRQVLLNLATNAVKFTYNGSIEISVTLLDRTGDRANVEFAVRDTGQGISESDRGKLFKNFSQLGNSTGSPMTGSGLGLAISRGLVEIMSGTIGVESVLGKGSRFWFRLPLVVDAEAVAGTGGTALLPSVPPLPPKTVLVVDDNETVRTVIAGQLSSRGHFAETAESALKGLSMLKSNRFDVVILDISMPVMDGFEALRIIKAMPGEAGRTPVIALTAHALIEDRERCLAAGFDQFLTKPVRSGELVQAIAVATSAHDPVEKHAAPPASGEVVPLFDLRELREQFLSVAPADLHRIIERFGSELDQQLALLTGEGSDISPHHLRRIVHVLSGSSSMIGAKRLAVLAGRLDALATRHEDEELAASLPDLVDTIETTRAALHDAARDLEAETA
jgi:CheY-like chemotaxis protein/HPt (histidine-containing phosphotransfer) domain-containing protein